MRINRSFLFAASLLMAAHSAVAAPDTSTPTPGSAQAEGLVAADGGPVNADQRGYVVVPPASLTAEADEEISKIIFLNRCRGGCTINKGNTSDARTNTSRIPDGAGPFQITEFAGTDEQWNAVVACVRDVYSPYDVTITDVDPGEGVLHHEAIVAGRDSEIGISGALGVGQLAGDCGAYNNIMSFNFANAHPENGFVENLCWTVAQETAHSYGLDHEFDCHTPMTYLPGCERKFFRNKNFRCGEFDGERDCRCGGFQNTHVRMLALFGQGTQPPAPTMQILTPSNNTAVTNQFSVIVQASDDRGVFRAEMWINGYKWNEATYDQYSQSGTFTVAAPAGIPDGVMDLEIRMFNDLDAMSSQTITVTKGSPCAGTDTCLEGQKCEQGKCFWDPPTAELGTACEYPQFCKSGVCEAGICTELCSVGVTGDCAAGFECTSLSGGINGYCATTDGDDGGGCCSVDNRTGITPVLVNIGLLGLVSMFLLRRRRA